MSTILENYLLEPSFVSSGNNAVWTNQSEIIGSNPSNTRYAYVSSPDKNYTTDLFVSRFNDEDRKAFLNTYENYEVSSITYYIKFKIQSPNSNGSISMHMSLSLDDTVLSVTPKYKTSTYSSADSGVKTAEIVFDLTTGVPSRTNLLEAVSLFARFSFSASDMIVSQNIYVYEILQVINVEEIAGPIISITNNDVLIQDSVTIDLGSFIQNEPSQVSFSIKNNGSNDLIINSIQIANIGIKEISFVPLPTSISPTKKELLLVNLDTSIQGEFNSQKLKIYNNSTNIPLFFLTITFKVISSNQSNPPTIVPFYGSTQIVKNRSFVINSVPLEISKTISLLFYNQGQSLLAINGVTISGDASIGAGTTLIAGSNISNANYAILNLSLITSTLGNKLVTVIVTSNDAINNPFVFTIRYSVLPHSSLTFFADNKSLVDGEKFDIGSIDKGKSYTKSYILKNDGVYKNLMINSLTASENLSIIGTYSLPFALAPLGANSLVVTVLFDTLSVGLKDGIFTINYSEGSVPS